VSNFDAQVIGVPDKRLGEQIAAWIRLKPDQTATAEEIKEYCKGQVGKGQVLKNR